MRLGITTAKMSIPRARRAYDSLSVEGFQTMSGTGDSLRLGVCTKLRLWRHPSGVEWVTGQHEDSSGSLASRLSLQSVVQCAALRSSSLLVEFEGPNLAQYRNGDDTSFHATVGKMYPRQPRSYRKPTRNMCQRPLPSGEL